MNAEAGLHTARDAGVSVAAIALGTLKTSTIARLATAWSAIMMRPEPVPAPAYSDSAACIRDKLTGELLIVGGKGANLKAFNRLESAGDLNDSANI
jgi:hypothetical protein